MGIIGLWAAWHVGKRRAQRDAQREADELQDRIEYLECLLEQQEMADYWDYEDDER